MGFYRLFEQRMDVKSRCIWCGLTIKRRKSFYILNKINLLVNRILP